MRILMMSAFVPNTPGGVPNVLTDLVNNISVEDRNVVFFYFCPIRDKITATTNIAYIFSEEFYRARDLWLDYGFGRIDCDWSEVEPLLLSYCIKMAKAIQHLHIDIIHSHTDWYVASVIADLLKVPHIATLHGFIPEPEPLMYQTCRGSHTEVVRDKVALMKQKGVAFVSSFIETMWHQAGMPVANTKVINVSIDFPRFRAETSKRVLDKYPKDRNKKLVCLPQRPDKPHTTQVLQSLLNLSRYCNFRLLICVGNGSLTEDQCSILKEFPDAFTDTFSANEMGSVYAVSDLCILTSPIEPVGLPSCEALYCGTPIVVPYQGGYAENFLEGGSGIYLYDSFDTKDFIEKVLRALEFEKTGEILLPERIRGRFHPRYVAQQYLHCYQNALGE